jgi:hypothetical protein
MIRSVSQGDTADYAIAPADLRDRLRAHAGREATLRTMDENTRALLDAHEKASSERQELMEKMGELQRAVFNGLLDRVDRIDSRLWWVITTIVVLNAASAVVMILAQ